MTTTPARPAIETAGLRKSFGDRTVLDGIDLRIPEGSVFALLGPNGAGKTTMVRILSTLIPADAGRAAVGGYDVAGEAASVREIIGVTGQFSAVDNLLTGRENLIMMADLYHLGRVEGRRRADELLARFDLSDAAGKIPATYSGGMKRRLDLAMTLVSRPRIIFLDEPTTGLDPRSRRDVWDIIRELVAGGTTVLLTTQYLDEADQLADRVAVLDHGRFVAEGTPGELKRLVPGGHVVLRFNDQANLARAVTLLPGATSDEENLTLRVEEDGRVRSMRVLLERIDDAGLDVGDLTVHTPDLDDVFLALTGRPGTEKEAAR